jgi:hypothetical protein
MESLAPRLSLHDKSLEAEKKPVYVMNSCARAGVAQLVEQRFRKPQVVRSIRIAGSSFSHGTLRS